MMMMPGRADLDDRLDDPIEPRFEELAEEIRKKGFSEEQVKKIVLAVGGPGFNMNLFPNVSLSLAHLARSRHRCV